MKKYQYVKEVILTKCVIRFSQYLLVSKREFGMVNLETQYDTQRHVAFRTSINCLSHLHLVPCSQLPTCSVRNKVSEFLQCCGVKTSPLTLLLYTDRQLKLLKKIIYGSQSYKQHITNMPLVKSRGWQNCLLG
jgi:hypothetical protein